MVALPNVFLANSSNIGQGKGTGGGSETSH